MRFISIGEAAKALGVGTQTLRRWDEAGKLIPHHKTNSGRRIYSVEQINGMLGLTSDRIGNSPFVVGYCRVNSRHGREDLIKQQENISNFCTANGYQFSVITDIGRGVNFKRSGLAQLLKMVQGKEVCKIVLPQKDVLLHYGYELIEMVCENHGVRIEVIDHSNTPNEIDLADDLACIISSFSKGLPAKLSDKSKAWVYEITKEIKNQTAGPKQSHN